MKYILSFDIAKGKSVYCFIDELKNIIIEPTLIEHNKNDFDNLFNLIKDYPNLIVVMESTSIYHLPVENYFRSKAFDTVVCNPPYFKVATTPNLNTIEYKTIARHEIKLNLEQIINIAKKVLKNNGNIAMVHRPERLSDIITIMIKNNIEPKRIRFVYPKETKEANILLIEGVKNGRPGLKILPPLYSHCENGEYSKQIKKYFEN